MSGVTATRAAGRPSAPIAAQAQSFLASAQVHQPDLVDFDSTEREPVGRRPEDLARLCDLL